MRPAEAEAHIKRYGHEALYSRHECRECQFTWKCEQTQCKLMPEGILCRACEVEALLSEVLNVADALLPALSHEIWTPSDNESILWAKSLMVVIKPRLQALRDDAFRITQMERV